jgi:large subunit ribosomal protein L25
MSEALKVEARQSLGKRNSRRLRNAGAVPIVLYGHGEKALSLSVSAEQLSAVLRHGAHVVDLQGAVTETAFIRDLQWDTFGTGVVHMDLTRVTADERVNVELPVVLRGDAVGVKDGGHLEQFVHSVEVECLVTAIPEKLELRVHELALGASLHAGDIDLPPGVKLLSAADEVVVHCALPVKEEEVGGVSEGAEPEIIGRKPEAEAEGEEK